MYVQNKFLYNHLAIKKMVIRRQTYHQTERGITLF